MLPPSSKHPAFLSRSPLEIGAQGGDHAFNWVVRGRGRTMAVRSTSAPALPPSPSSSLPCPPARSPMDRLLNFNEPLDVGLLDQVVAAVYAGNDQQARFPAPSPPPLLPALAPLTPLLVSLHVFLILLYYNLLCLDLRLASSSCLLPSPPLLALFLRFASSLSSPLPLPSHFPFLSCLSLPDLM